MGIKLPRPSREVGWEGQREEQNGGRASLFDSKVRICSDRLFELTQNHLPEVVDLWGKAKSDFQKIKVTAAALRDPLF